MLGQLTTAEAPSTAIGFSLPHDIFPLQRRRGKITFCKNGQIRIRTAVTRSTTEKLLVVKNSLGVSGFGMWKAVRN